MKGVGRQPEGGLRIAGQGPFLHKFGSYTVFFSGCHR